jgi:exodeoxyribonuclease VII small subunit
MPEKQRTSKKSPDDAVAAPPFEEALAELEKNIEKLESDDLTLDKSLELFERGIVLLRTCDTHLKKAQGKISALLKGDNGEYVEKVLGTTLESFFAKEETDE